MPRFKKTIANSVTGINLSSKQIIIKFLTKNGDTRHKELVKHFRECGISFHDHKGLDYILKRLINDKIVKKIGKKPNKPYPTYRILKEYEKNIQGQANRFSLTASNELFKEIKNMRIEKALEELVIKVGTYTIFSYLEGWSRHLDKTSLEERRNILASWMSNVFPIPDLDIKLIELGALDEEKRSIKRFYNILEKLFPKEMHLCREISSDLSRK